MEKLGRYYEMPMTIAVRIVMIVMTVMVRFAIVAITIAMPMILVVVMVPLMLVGMLSVGRGSFHMDMGNIVPRMVVPQGAANPRYRSRVQQQRICGMENTECSRPAKCLLPEWLHLWFSNN